MFGAVGRGPAGVLGRERVGVVGDVAAADVLVAQIAADEALLLFLPGDPADASERRQVEEPLVGGIVVLPDQERRAADVVGKGEAHQRLVAPAARALQRGNRQAALPHAALTIDETHPHLAAGIAAGVAVFHRLRHALGRERAGASSRLLAGLQGWRDPGEGKDQTHQRQRLITRPLNGGGAAGGGHGRLCESIHNSVKFPPKTRLFRQIAVQNRHQRQLPGLGPGPRHLDLAGVDLLGRAVCPGLAQRHRGPRRRRAAVVAERWIEIGDRHAEPARWAQPCRQAECGFASVDRDAPARSPSRTSGASRRDSTAALVTRARSGSVAGIDAASASSPAGGDDPPPVGRPVPEGRRSQQHRGRVAEPSPVHVVGAGRRRNCRNSESAT